MVLIGYKYLLAGLLGYYGLLSTDDSAGCASCDQCLLWDDSPAVTSVPDMLVSGDEQDDMTNPQKLTTIPSRTFAIIAAGAVALVATAFYLTLSTSITLYQYQLSWSNS